MTNTCIVFDCMSGDADSGELGHFFRVPTDLELQKKWAQAIPKVKEPLTTEHFVCDKHFLESDMIRYYILKDDAGIVVKKVPYTYPRLTDTAVPSIFSGFEIQQNVENPEPLQRAIGPDVILYDNPVTNAYTHLDTYSILQDISYDVGHATHVHGQNTRPEVANGISGDSTLISGDISQSITKPPDVSIDGTTDIATQITASSADFHMVGNEISEQPGIINSAATGSTFLPQNDTATDTMNLVGSISKPDSGWENVIVDQPVSTSHQTSPLFDPTVAIDYGCWTCANGDHYCGHCNCCNCCCDDCHCDGCGECDCGGCGDCDCGGCGNCDCGGHDCIDLDCSDCIECFIL